MGKYQRKKIWWTSFTVNGIAYRQSLRTKKKAEAVKKEREVIARASAGMIEIQRAAPKKLFAAIDAYTEHKRLRWTKPRTAELEQELLKVIKTYFGDVPLRAITALAIAQFQKLRKEPPIDKLAANGTPVSQGATFTSPLTGAVMKSHASNRTINMNVAALGRVLKYVGSWAAIEKQVERLGLDPFPLTE